MEWGENETVGVGFSSPHEDIVAVAMGNSNVAPQRRRRIVEEPEATVAPTSLSFEHPLSQTASVQDIANGSNVFIGSEANIPGYYVYQIDGPIIRQPPGNYIIIKWIKRELLQVHEQNLYHKDICVTCAIIFFSSLC